MTKHFKNGVCELLKLVSAIMILEMRMSCLEGASMEAIFRLP